MFTISAAQNILNQLAGKTTGGLGSATYLALSATIPNIEGGGITEPVGNGYSRALIGSSSSGSKMGTPTFDSATGKITMVNEEEIHFTEATGSWGNLTHFAIYSSKTGGTPLYVGELVSPITPAVNNVVLIRIGDLSISLQ